MKTGAGRSLIAWRKYLTHPKTKISFIEKELKESYKEINQDKEYLQFWETKLDELSKGKYGLKAK